MITRRLGILLMCILCFGIVFAEDIETLEYKNKVFVVRYKRTNERYVVEMKDANLRQLEEFKRFIKDDGILIKPKISRDELPFSGTEKGSPMQKKKPVKKTKIVAVRPKAHVEITIERMGKHTRITMPKSMDNDTVCLVIK